MSNFDLISRKEKLDILTDERFTALERALLLANNNKDIFPVDSFTVYSFIPEIKPELHISLMHKTMNNLVSTIKLVDSKLKELGYQDV
jgi:hypothetical protein